MEFAAAKQRLCDQYDRLPRDAGVRLSKPTSNLFRMRPPAEEPGLDVSAFDGVLRVDVRERTADVLGMTTYEHLVDETLRYGLVPLVVPELKTITLGGAVTGLGIESASFRNGCPHESVLEMEVLTGDGRILTVAPDGEHAGLFAGFPNSYGTLGYALRLTIELEPVRPFVELRHTRFGDAESYFAAVSSVVDERSWQGTAVDFVDGTVFGPHEMYLTTARYVTSAPYTSDYAGNRIYYQSLRRRSRDYLSVRDYLWRWDTDWFWCSRALGVQNPLLRPLVPRRLLRSDVYFKAVGFERRHQVVARLRRWSGRPASELVVQDVEVPVERAAQFLDVFQREVGLSPVWICPLRQRDSSQVWPLYRLEPSTTYVNFGFWGAVSQNVGDPADKHNRLVEELVTELGGRKSLYSTSTFEKDQFWALYNGAEYDVLKKTYDPDGRLLDLYDKCVRAR
ncbi:MAG: FAD-binding oxidoreductase [Actinomycetes bacterium]